MKEYGLEDFSKNIYPSSSSSLSNFHKRVSLVWRYIGEDSKNRFLFIHNKWKFFISSNVIRFTKVLENRIFDNMKKKFLKKKLDHMRENKRRTTKQQNLIIRSFFSFLKVFKSNELVTFIQITNILCISMIFFQTE